MKVSPHRLTRARPCMRAFVVWLGLVTGTRPRAHPVPYLPHTLTLYARGCTSIHFGENQLSPGSIGISPLSTGHPPVLQHRWVRASTRSYPRFTLPMDSSPGFGSPARDRPGTAPCSDSLSLRLRRSLLRLNPPGPSREEPRPRTRTRRIILQKARRQAGPGALAGPTPDALRLLVGAGFQALFHSPRGGLFTFPSRYSSAIGGHAC